MDSTRTDSARRHDDRDLIEDGEPTPPESSTSGGTLAADIATEDELDDITAAGGTTRVHKRDEVDMSKPRRADHQGAQ